jgi:rubrerythrin
MKAMTKKALEEAFAGESMAHMKYMAFSVAAEKEGKPNISRLFKATAFAERVHATNHARNLGYLKSTADNLQAGIDGENFEVQEMYPAYDAVATLQEEKGAKLSIHYAIEAEKEHSVLYRKALETLNAGSDVGGEDIWVCDICGYTHMGGVPDNCPVCKAKKERFSKF